MSLLFFASIAPLLAKASPMYLESALSEFAVLAEDSVRALDTEDSRQPLHHVNSNMVPPESLDQIQRPMAVSASYHRLLDNQHSLQNIQSPLDSPLDSPDDSGVQLSQASPESTSLDRSTSIDYEVNPGDTLWDIAQRFNIPLHVIIDSNPEIIPDKLPVGHVLTLPRPQIGDRQDSNSEVAVMSNANERDDSRQQNGISYTVQRGDTVWAIAHTVNLPPQTILDANPDIIPEQLRVDQVLVIPSPSESHEATTAPVVEETDQPTNIESLFESSPFVTPSSRLEQEWNDRGNSILHANPGDKTDVPSSLDVGSRSIPNSTVRPWLLAIDTPEDTWQIGAIALLGLGLTLVGWYGWQKRSKLQLSLNPIEREMLLLNQTSDKPALTNDLRQQPQPPGFNNTVSIANETSVQQHSNQTLNESDQTVLRPQLSMRLVLLFGHLAMIAQRAINVELLQALQDKANRSPRIPNSLASRQDGSRHPSVQSVVHGQPTALQTKDSPATSEVVAFRNSNPEDVPVASENPNEEENWSTTVQNILDQPPSNLPQKFIASGILFCVLFGSWAWVGTIEEVGYAQGQLVPQGEVYDVAFPESGRVINVAVEEGQTVEKGQILFELDTQVAESEMTRLRDLLLNYELELAEKQRLIPKLRQEAEALTWITRTNVEALDAAINRVHTSATTTNALVNQLQIDAEAHYERTVRISNLVDEGALSRETLFQAEQALRERQRSVLENQGMLRESRSQLDQLQAELEQKQAEGQRQQINVQQQLQRFQTEVLELQARILDTQNLLSKATVELEQRYLYAPVEGVVSSIRVANSGEFVQPGETIAEIIPSGTPLVLSAVLPSEEAGFVSLGMPVQIKLDAYPFQDFGVISGDVQSIAPNSEEHEQLGAVYRVEIRLDKNYLETPGNIVQFKAGSTARAEIVIRQRRIADILLDPIKQLQNDGLSL
ncbi:MAG: LysM peptidoglycan-binding domain-containing protein [Cyanobacteria bacterium P01_A01_bin.37]